MGLSPEYWQAVVRGSARGPSAFVLRRLLWLARGPYAVGVWWRNRRFDLGRDVHRVEVPVISIGNLTVGGTGKTPCVEYVATVLRTHEYRVAILSRGYGAEAGRNDEAMVLEENLPAVPHYQDRDRVAIARTAIEESESEVLVLDDGFQHRRLARDLDIVLIDATDPWGSGYLLPRGGLREPIGGLRRAGFVLLTRCDQVDATALDSVASKIRQFHPGLEMARSIHAPLSLLNGNDTAEVSSLRGQTISAFCGIGNPESFRQTLLREGAVIRDFRVFADHHAYSHQDVNDLNRWAATLPADAWVLTTQKDWVKLRLTHLGERPLWALRIGIKFTEGQAAFDRAILSAVKTQPRPSDS